MFNEYLHVETSPPSWAQVDADLGDKDALHFECSSGLARIRELTFYSLPGINLFDYAEKLPTPDEALMKMTGEQQADYDQLSHEERVRYPLFKLDAHISAFQTLYVYADGVHGKNGHVPGWHKNIQHFPLLKKAISSMSLRRLTSAYFLVTHPNVRFPTHRELTGNDAIYLDICPHRGAVFAVDKNASTRLYAPAGPAASIKSSALRGIDVTPGLSYHLIIKGAR